MKRFTISLLLIVFAASSVVLPNSVYLVVVGSEVRRTGTFIETPSDTRPRSVGPTRDPGTLSPRVGPMDLGRVSDVVSINVSVLRTSEPTTKVNAFAQHDTNRLRAEEETRLAVKHDHFWGSCEGELVFDETGVRYETKEAKHARAWRYQDIQQLGLEPAKVVVLTYRDRAWHLGQDENLNFEVTGGQVTDSLRALLEQKLTRPLVSSVLPAETETRYRIPVKHRKTLSGTQGVLEFSDEYLTYRTGDKRDARVWQYEDLISVGTTGPYQLRITAMERTGGEYGSGRNFVFDLKEKLPERAYDFLWNKINRPRIDGGKSAP